MTVPVLELKDVSHEFRQGEAVLSGVSMSLMNGEFLALVGASGSGKSTILRVLQGIIRPTRGSVFANGTDVTGRPGADRAMVFQQDRLYPWRTVLANASFGLEIQGHGPADAHARALKALQLVGLGGMGDRRPHELSGGMRQRVNLARALALAPDALLMDEPFSALDAQTREFMQLEILNVWSAAETSVLFVTHQIEEAVYLADRVVVLAARPGRVKRIINVPLGRPRPLAIKREQRFQDLCSQVWTEIEQDVKAVWAT